MSEVATLVYARVRLRDLGPHSRGIYVRRSLSFNEEIVNIGGAMDSREGVFTVPKSGTYLFTGTVDVLTEYSPVTPFVYLRGVETEVVTRSHRSMKLIRPFVHSLSFQAIAHLETGDQVELELSFIKRLDGWQWSASFEDPFQRLELFELTGIPEINSEFVVVLLNEVASEDD